MVNASNRETPWPAWPFRPGDTSIDDLQARLIRVAAYNARRATELHKSGKYEEQVDAAISAGVALEMISKACVAKVNPVLLAGKPAKHHGVQKSILILSGDHHESVVKPSDVHDFNTISASEALSAAQNFDKNNQLPTDQKDDGKPNAATDLVIKARDAAIHLGYVDSGSIGIIVSEMAAYIEGALDFLGVHDVAFWQKTSREDIARLIADFSTREQERVQEKVNSASRLYADTYEDVDKSTLTRIAEFNRHTAKAASSSDLDVTETCPACRNEGWYELHADFEYEPDIQEITLNGHWIIDHFRCPFCNLKLEHDELSYAGLEDDGDELMAQLGDPNAEDDYMEQARGM